MQTNILCECKDERNGSSLGMEDSSEASLLTCVKRNKSHEFIVWMMATYLILRDKYSTRPYHFSKSMKTLECVLRW